MLDVSLAGFCLHWLGHYDNAIKAAKNSHDVRSAPASAHYDLAILYAITWRSASGVQARRKVEALDERLADPIGEGCFLRSRFVTT